MADQVWVRSLLGPINPPAFTAERDTTDATLQLLYSLTVDDNAYWVLDVEVIGYDSSATLAHARLAVRANRSAGGGATVTSAALVTADTTGGTVSAAANGNAVEIKVQAANARNMKWACFVHSVLKVAKAT